jgi:putative phosphoesterase
MRIAVISDLHANLPALRAVVDDAARIGCDELWCLGDVVGRGPHPNEVCDELRRLGIPVVQGNWDEAVGMDRDQPGTLWPSADAEAAGQASLAWTREHVTDAHRSWLRGLPMTLRLTAEDRSALLFHGSTIRQTEYLWADRPSRAFARIAADEGDDVFCFGHTHESFHRVVGPAHFVAAGSVGCGGEGDARARYAVIYVGGDIAIGFRSVDYDHATVVADLAAAKLPIDLLGLLPTAHPRGQATEAAAS